MIKIKNIHETPEIKDSFRILVDQKLPQGISKEDLKLNLWVKNLAPSNEINEWSKEEPDNWEEFKNKYKNELKGKKELIKQIKIIEKFNKTVTLVYSEKDEKQNNAIVIRELLQKPTKQIIMSVGRIHGS